MSGGGTDDDDIEEPDDIEVIVSHSTILHEEGKYEVLLRHMGPGRHRLNAAIGSRTVSFDIDGRTARKMINELEPIADKKEVKVRGGR